MIQTPAGRMPFATTQFSSDPSSGGHKTAPVRDGFVLIDAWSYAARDVIPWSWDRANPHVLATNEPNTRIDYVFTGVPRDDGRGAVRFVTRIGADPVDGVWASDHAGLIVDIQAGS